TLGLHRVDEGHVVNACRQVRQQVADPASAVSPLMKSKRAFHQVARLTEEGVELSFAGQGLAMMFDEVGLVVERVNMTYAACTEDLNRSFGLGGKMAGPRSVRRFFRRSRFGSKRFILQQPGERDAAQPRAEVGEEVAAVREIWLRTIHHGNLIPTAREYHSL